jgi:chromatin segregation and condensation protein Rec8/ScpA/Scc1 (kleisin family)
MAEERSTHLTLSLPRFDGPFELLLSLVRHNQWSIDDIPVLEITRQFLAYVRSSSEMDMELGGEFVETASWLVLLKSRSLLPQDEIDGPTPREELRRAVLDHVTLAQAAEFLRDRYDRDSQPAGGGAPAGREPPALPPSEEDDPTLEDVLRSATEALAAARAAASFRGADVAGITVEDQLHWVGAKLDHVPLLTALSTEEWFAEQPTPVARIALLLALLELARMGCILLHQASEFSTILVKTLSSIPADFHLEDSVSALQEFPAQQVEQAAL